MNVSKVVEEFLTSHKVAASVLYAEEKHPLYRVFISLDAGTQLSKLMNLSSEIGLALKAKDVPIIQPLYSQGSVKLEFLLDEYPIVDFHTLVKNTDFSFYELPCLLGASDIDKPLVVDLKSAPHMLIGGTTGSGKSMILHSVLNSLMQVAATKAIEFVLIDPKHVEFALYAKNKYLAKPMVCTTVDSAESALNWAVKKMNERLALLSNTACRDWESYRKLGHANKKPYTVIVIDELSDLLLSGKKSIKQNLTMLAQKSRAAGIHLVVATQHPSAKVLSSELRANFSTVVGCKVASAVHSRVLFGVSGAQNLLGCGDALINGSGMDMLRFKGCFVDFAKVEAAQKRMRPSFLSRMLG